MKETELYENTQFYSNTEAHWISLRGYEEGTHKHVNAINQVKEDMHYPSKWMSCISGHEKGSSSLGLDSATRYYCALNSEFEKRLFVLLDVFWMWIMRNYWKKKSLVVRFCSVHRWVHCWFLHWRVKGMWNDLKGRFEFWDFSSQSSMSQT